LNKRNEEIIQGGAFMGNTVNLETLGDGVYIVQQGTIVEVLEPKEYGQDSIQWQRGKVFEVSESKRRRIGKPVQTSLHNEFTSC